MSGIVLRVFHICGLAVWKRRCAAGRSPRRTAGCPLACEQRGGRFCSGFSRMARERPASVSESASAALRSAMPQPTGRPLFAGPVRVRSTWARTLASQQSRTCGVLYGLRRTKQNRRRLRTAVSSRTAWRRARRAGRPERSPIWRLARMRFKRRCCGRGVSATRAKPAGFPKGKWCASGGASDEISGRYAFSRL